MRYFYLFEWSDLVIDVREQYPLLDIDLATRIAEDMESQGYHPGTVQLNDHHNNS